MVTLSKIAGLENMVQLLFNLTPVNVDSGYFLNCMKSNLLYFTFSRVERPKNSF